jgi:chromosome segregation ATPase
MPTAQTHPFRLLMIATALLAAMALMWTGTTQAADGDEDDQEDGPASHLQEVRSELKNIHAELEALSRHAKALKQQIPLLEKMVEVSAKIEQAESAGDDAQIEALEEEMGEIEMKLEVIHWTITLGDLEREKKGLAELKMELDGNGDAKRSQAADGLIKQITPIRKQISALVDLTKTGTREEVEEAADSFHPAWEAFEKQRDLFFLDLDLKHATEENDLERIKELQQEIKERTEGEEV